MKTAVRNNLTFLSLNLVLILALGLVLYSIPKAELHLLLGSHHTNWLDIFFRYYTEIGGWIPYVACAFLLFYRFGWTAICMSSLALSGAITQFLKYQVEAIRPMEYFLERNVALPVVEGIDPKYWLSFPSGHTASIFVLFAVICFIGTQHISCRTGRQIWQVGCFVLAALGGYSRIYLNMHFTMDVWAGMGIGLLCFGGCYILFSRFKDKKWWKMHFFEKKSL